MKSTVQAVDFCYYFNRQGSEAERRGNMEKLREICSKTFTPEEMQMLDRAIEFTKGVHAHQTRHSGEPIIPIRKAWP